MIAKKFRFDLSKERKDYQINQYGSEIVVTERTGSALLKLDSIFNDPLDLSAVSKIKDAQFSRLYLTNEAQPGKWLEFYVLDGIDADRTALNLNELAVAITDLSTAVEENISQLQIGVSNLSSTVDQLSESYIQLSAGLENLVQIAVTVTEENGEYKMTSLTVGEGKITIDADKFIVNGDAVFGKLSAVEIAADSAIYIGNLAIDRYTPNDTTVDVVDPNSNVIHSYWIEHDINGNPTGHIWIKLNNAIDLEKSGRIRIIIEPVEGYSQSGSAVGNVFNDFDSDTSGINLTNATYTLSNGKLIISNGYGYIYNQIDVGAHLSASGGYRQLFRSSQIRVYTDDQGNLVVYDWWANRYYNTEIKPDNGATIIQYYRTFEGPLRIILNGSDICLAPKKEESNGIPLPPNTLWYSEYYAASTISSPVKRPESFEGGLFWEYNAYIYPSTIDWLACNFPCLATDFEKENVDFFTASRLDGTVIGAKNNSTEVWYERFRIYIGDKIDLSQHTSLKVYSSTNLVSLSSDGLEISTVTYPPSKYGSDYIIMRNVYMVKDMKIMQMIYADGKIGSTTFTSSTNITLKKFRLQSRVWGEHEILYRTKPDKVGFHVAFYANVTGVSTAGDLIVKVNGIEIGRYSISSTGFRELYAEAFEQFVQPDRYDFTVTLGATGNWTASLDWYIYVEFPFAPNLYEVE